MHETDERREPTEETFDEPDPRWEPAERHLPHELLPDLMWMDEVVAEGRAIQQYKHCVTKRYLNLDVAGQAWDVLVDAETGEVADAQRLDPAIALACLEGREDSMPPQPDPFHGTYTVQFDDVQVPSVTVTTDQWGIALPLDQVGEMAGLHFVRSSGIPGYARLYTSRRGGIYRDPTGVLITNLTITPAVEDPA